MIPLRHTNSNKISRLLKKRNIRKNYIPKFIQYRCWGLSRKDLELTEPDVYRRSARRTESKGVKSRSSRGQHQHGSLRWFLRILIFHRTYRHVGGLVKKATEINLDKNNFNRDGGSIASQAWWPVTQQVNERQSRINQSSTYLMLPTNFLDSPPALTGRYVMTRSWLVPWRRWQRWQSKRLSSRH